MRAHTPTATTTIAPLLPILTVTTSCEKREGKNQRVKIENLFLTLSTLTLTLFVYLLYVTKPVPLFHAVPVSYSYECPNVSSSPPALIAAGVEPTLCGYVDAKEI